MSDPEAEIKALFDGWDLGRDLETPPIPGSHRKEKIDEYATTGEDPPSLYRGRNARNVITLTESSRRNKFTPDSPARRGYWSIDLVPNTTRPTRVTAWNPNQLRPPDARHPASLDRKDVANTADQFAAFLNRLQLHSCRVPYCLRPKKG